MPKTTIKQTKRKNPKISTKRFEEMIEEVTVDCYDESRRSPDSSVFRRIISKPCLQPKTLRPSHNLSYFSFPPATSMCGSEKALMFHRAYCVRVPGGS